MSLTLGLGWLASGCASDGEGFAASEVTLAFPGCDFKFACDAGEAAIACGTDQVQTLADCLPSVAAGPIDYAGCVIVAVTPQAAWCIANRCVKFTCHG